MSMLSCRAVIGVNNKITQFNQSTIQVEATIAVHGDGSDLTSVKVNGKAIKPKISDQESKDLDFGKLQRFVTNRALQEFEYALKKMHEFKDEQLLREGSENWEEEE